MSHARERRERVPTPPPGAVRSRLRFGVNEARGWRDFALGRHRAQIGERLGAIATRIVRIYVFDRAAPDPVRDWPTFASYVQAVLAAGAVPMITLTRFRAPFDDAATIRWFAQRCGELMWNCLEQWGGAAVREWYWCIWNEPNSDWINPGFTFEKYREIYRAVAPELLRWLAPYLGDRRASIGGPAIDTFQPFWFDWLWRFVHEIDDDLIGFVLWHHFGDWRAPGEWGAPREPAIYRRLLLERTEDYAEIAATVARLVERRGILNICGRLNANAHHQLDVSGAINRSLVGAVHYATALVQLMRGGADAELYWMGTDGEGPHGLWDGQARATPAFRAKELVAQAVRPGDDIVVHDPQPGRRESMLVEISTAGRRRAVLVLHLSDERRTCDLGELLGNGDDFCLARKIDNDSADDIVTLPFVGKIRFNGLGVALAMTDAMRSESRRNGR